MSIIKRTPKVPRSVKIFYSSLGILFAAFCKGAIAANFQFNPIPLADYATKAANPGIARLKISVAMENSTTTPALTFSGIVICSKTACYRPNLLSNRGSANTSNGSAKLVVDAAMPYEQIEKIFFEESKGGNVSGSIELTRHLNVEKGYYGGEIFVTLRRTAINGAPNYLPSFATSNFLRENGTSIYYNPRFPVAANLDQGVSLKIPARALNTPEIFNVQIHDTGDQFPLVDIYPYVKFLKNATLTASLIQRSTSANISAVTSSTGRTSPIKSHTSAGAPPSGSGKSPTQIAAPSQVARSISGTGVLNSSSFEAPQASAITPSNGDVPTPSLLHPVAEAGPARTACSDILSNTSNMQTLQNLLRQYGVVRITWCETVPPFVTIVYVNTSDSRVRFKITYADAPNPRNRQLRVAQLRRQTDFGGNVTINGFYWTGDEGTGPNQYGLTNGYLLVDGAVHGSNIVGGGASGPNEVGDGHKYVMATMPGASSGMVNPIFFESSEAHYVYPGATNQVSTSTSIYKNGNCSGDTTASRWSAVGGRTGAMFFVSSKSGYTTTAKDLCGIFYYLNAAGALRLDGGPSAQMTIDGININPLTGLYSFKYGSMRYVAYGLQAYKVN